VISDIVMPGGMDGIQLAHKIRGQYPQIPILLISGYSGSAISAATGFVLLKKPFNAADLNRALREAMTQHNIAPPAQSANAAG
jgi:CheY-like chemotaxis protein